METGKARARPGAQAHTHTPAHEDEPSDDTIELRRYWVESYRSAHGITPGRRCAWDEFRREVRACREQGVTDEEIRGAVDRYFADARTTAEGHPHAWFVKDLRRWLAKTRPSRRADPAWYDESEHRTPDRIYDEIDF